MNKYRLVPATEAVPNVPTSTLTKKRSPSPENRLLDLIELFPARLHHRAKLMLNHLKGKIGITEDNRIIYFEPVEEAGSSQDHITCPS